MVAEGWAAGEAVPLVQPAGWCEERACSSLEAEPGQTGLDGVLHEVVQQGRYPSGADEVGRGPHGLDLTVVASEFFHGSGADDGPVGIACHAAELEDGTRTDHRSERVQVTHHRGPWRCAVLQVALHRRLVAGQGVARVVPDDHRTDVPTGRRVPTIVSGRPDTGTQCPRADWARNGSGLPLLGPRLRAGSSGDGQDIAVSPTPALHTALDYHRAWTSGNLDTAMGLVDDGIVCRAPGEEITGKGAYRAYLGGFSQMMTGLTDIAAFGDGPHVALFYCPHTAVTSTAPAAEHFTVRDQRIVESLLVFDRLSYAPQLAQ